MIEGGEVARDVSRRRVRRRHVVARRRPRAARALRAAVPGRRDASSRTRRRGSRRSSASRQARVMRLARPRRAPRRARLHAPADRRAARARDDRGRGRGGDHGLRHGARVRGQRAAARRVLRDVRRAERARVVTKGGMARPGGGWVPDGRARSIRADCEASLAALDGLPDRPLPPPRAGPADAVAHVRACARPARRRGPRARASASAT